MKNQDSDIASSALKRSRSEGSILDASEIAASKSMGGSEGNISQCSVQSSKTRKSAELVIEENGKNNDIHYHISSCSKYIIFYLF